MGWPVLPISVVVFSGVADVLHDQTQLCFSCILIYQLWGHAGKTLFFLSLTTVALLFSCEQWFKSFYCIRRYTIYRSSKYVLSCSGKKERKQAQIPLRLPWCSDMTCHCHAFSFHFWDPPTGAKQHFVSNGIGIDFFFFPELIQVKTVKIISCFHEMSVFVVVLGLMTASVQHLCIRPYLLPRFNS